MPHLPDHQTDHDPQLIAAHAAGDAEGADLDRARDLVATCDECAALHHDLRAIAAAMPAIPAPARTRDFRLTPEQAASLRPAGWRRLLAPLAGPRFAFAAPLGGSLAALGLAGVLLAGAASTPMAGTATTDTTGGTHAVQPPTSLPGSERVAMAASAAPSTPDAALAAPVPAASAPAASAAAGVLAPDAGNAAGGGIAGTGPAESVAPGYAGGATGASVDERQASGIPVAGPVDTTTTASSPLHRAEIPPVVPIVSALLLIAGLVLLGIAFVRRRVGPTTP